MVIRLARAGNKLISVRLDHARNILTIKSLDLAENVLISVKPSRVINLLNKVKIDWRKRYEWDKRFARGIETLRCAVDNCVAFMEAVLYIAEVFVHVESQGRITS